MLDRRDILLALGFCLLFTTLSIEAKSLKDTSVKTKRESTDWWSILEDIIYDSDSESDDESDNENILVCRNCTVVVQAAPNATTSGAQPTEGSTTQTPVTPSGPTTVAAVTPAPSTATTVTPPAVTTATEATTPTAAPGG